MKLPTPEERIYGNEMYEKGFNKGYQKHCNDVRKMKMKKERDLFRKFSIYVDYMEDILSSNRKR